LTDLSSYALVGANNPNKAVSVTFWNGFVDALENEINGVEQLGAHPDAKAQGAAAFNDGMTLGDNPYSMASHPWSLAAWNGGWHSAKRGVEA
jgi:hypothetical protein